MTIDTPQTAETTPSTDFHPSIVRLAERVAGENKFKKFLPFGIPTLDQCIDGAPEPDSWEEEKLTEGEESAVVRTPVYKNAQLDYLQTALIQRIMGIARSKDNAGAAAPTNWIELLESSGGTKYPVQLKAFKEGLAEFLQDESFSLTDTQRAAILVYTDTRRLQEAEAHKKERIGHWFGKFIEALGDKASDFSSVVSNINKSLAFNPDEVDF